ncbi:serine hydrolase [Pelagibius sp.]|uniref:serine hydrolase domain-containing protein n=1 Tax=Pelagibius sp. TaxID=1931238 RepID=UPI002604C098|nr:serine hydrolase [Pelagibius sp.]
MAVILSAGLLAAGISWFPDDSRLRAEARTTADVVPLAAYESTRTYYPGEQWHRAERPETIGWSSAKLADARDHSRSLGTSAVVIVENGVIVDAWGELDKRYQNRSMRKSYLSMLFGQLVADGRIKLSATLEELGIDDEPPLTPAERQATVFDLLTARSGVYHPANFESKGMRRKRPARESHPPGSFWFYNNWDFNALGTIYERASGKGIFEAFREEIAAPLQMQHHMAEDTSYFEDKYSVHPAYRFRMSPLDLARIGLLYLRKGVWQGRQIVPAAWIDQSTQAHVDTGRKGFHAGYGFMWWVGEDGFAAVGARGQRLFVMPERNLVIVHLVDADEKDRRVSTKKIRGLLTKILAARTQARSDSGFRPAPAIRVTAAAGAHGILPGSSLPAAASAALMETR